VRQKVEVMLIQAARKLTRWCVLTGVVLGALALATGSARADTKTAGPATVSLARQLNAKSDGPSFAVTAAGKITVSATLHTKGFLPNDPNIRVRVALMKPNASGTLVSVTSKDATIGRQNSTTKLTHEVTAAEASAAKTWRVRITNIDTVNRMEAEGSVVVTFPSATRVLRVEPADKLTLFQGQTEDRTFKLSPNVKGRLDVEATWNTDLLGGGDFNKVPLRVRLFAPGKATPAAIVTMKSKLVLHHDVQQGELGSGNWRLEIHNPNNNGIENFVATVRFTPKS
jgi:hypothetical protein